MSPIPSNGPNGPNGPNWSGWPPPAFAVQGETAERWLEWLADLASYRPSDFLMFSARTYWRLFEQHNATWWPWPLVWPALAIGAVAWLARGSLRAQRATALALAATGVFVAQSFVRGLYEPVNWAAAGMAWVWWALSLALVAWAVAPGADRSAGAEDPASVDTSPRASRRDGDAGRRRTAAGLAAWALFGHPLLAVLGGRPMAQAEVAGLAPDATVIAVVAWLLQAPPAATGQAGRVMLTAAWGAAVALCLASAATLATMGEPQAAVMLAAPAVALAAANWERLRRRTP